ncbi:glycosyl transferase [Salinicoccus roseus]|uniref:glycosyl transferase n=1 Tax=Salinicoccus roseus TaxID=45670 RepID=UPI000F515743|nr:glycosyl transferase [Salinicoccus roseus]RPE54812.1 hypothetical protein EDC33_1075 [Salinicoccus roseus]GGA62462.1 hypothetical protein GCM10007176_03590 [Salinicoccus roseus]
MDHTIRSIAEINEIEFAAGEDIKVIYKSGNLNYHFRVIIKEPADQLLVLSNGAVDTSKKQPPVFMRHKWKEDFQSSLVYLDDPTIHDLGLRLGWGQGTRDEFALEIYNALITQLAAHLGIKDEQVFYYGSSAGGFMSMILASMHVGSTAIVNNPQTSIKNYMRNFSVPLLERVYGSVETAYDEYLHRVKVVEAFEKYNNMPRIFYAQNRACPGDMKQHYTPFLKQVNDKKLDTENLNLLLYHDKKGGHSPLAKNDTIHMIESIMKK